MLKAKISLILNYFIVALLLNSVSVFVMQMANQLHASPDVISAFAPVKDFTILCASFILASLIPKMGPKRSMILGLLCILVACIGMGIYPEVITSFVFFILLGVSFALIKVATYASVIHVTDSKKAHSSFLSLLEGFFMLGVLSMAWLFGISEKYANWTYVFWILAVMTVIAIFLTLTSSIDAKQAGKEGEEVKPEKNKFTLKILKVLFSSWIMWSFIIVSVCYVFIENGLTIWLPTFNNHFLNIETSIAIELISIFSLSLAVGRFFFAAILKFVNASTVLIICMACALVVFIDAMFVIESMPPVTSTITQWSQLPHIAFLLPLVGFIIAPIYPTFCSTLLTCYSEDRYQSPISSIIVIFSAVGGIAGASIFGYAFSVLGGAKGIAIPAIPLLIMLVLTIPYFWMIKRHHSTATTSLK